MKPSEKLTQALKAQGVSERTSESLTPTQRKGLGVQTLWGDLECRNVKVTKDGTFTFDLYRDDKPYVGNGFHIAETSDKAITTQATDNPSTDRPRFVGPHRLQSNRLDKAFLSVQRASGDLYKGTRAIPKGGVLTLAPPAHWPKGKKG